MRKIIGIVFLAVLFAFGASAQEVIKAKDAHNYIGKTVTVTGKIKSAGGPGLLSSMSFYLVTDSAEIGIGVTIPMKIWRKSKMLNEKQTGKIMKATGLIQLNGEPFTEVKNLSDVQISK